MKFAIFILLLCFSALQPSIAASVPDTNFFPIMPWNSTPNDPAALKKIKECGLTMAGFVAPDTLDACEKAGLKAIVSDGRTSHYDWHNVDEDVARSNVLSLVRQVANHPALFGYYLRDEPDSGMFPGLGKVASLIRENSPGKWPYINLFPDYASNNQLGATNYADYLERFISTCNPSIISYDNYSLIDDGSVRENYWTNLESIRAAALRHKINFWNIILSVAHFSYAEPDAAGLRFQVYTTLAYGGRGISYFTYVAPQVGNYRLAPIDQFGNPTPTWYWMQNVNLQIQKLAPTLLQLTSDAVYHFGTVPRGCQAPSTNSLLTNVSGGNYAVGEFTHQDGSRYVMIVNKDLKKSRACSPKWRNPPAHLRQVSPYTGNLTSFDGENVWLAPGQGVLLKLD